MKRIASIFIVLSLCTLPCFAETSSNPSAENNPTQANTNEQLNGEVETLEVIENPEEEKEAETDAVQEEYDDAKKAETSAETEPLGATTMMATGMIETKELTEEEKEAGIDAIQEKYDAAKAKEQSAANKLLSATTMMATGMGAMELASSMSEQKADQEAEDEMRAYLSTFYCQYGNKRVPGGNKNVETGGGNELINLYAQYVNLANDLKTRKAALDIAPGIESEAILDSATAGLYDDVNIGPRGSMFTSLARALADPTGEDAQKWKAQQEESAKGIKDGAIALGVGAIGSAVIDLAINHTGDKDKDDEDTEEDTEKSELCTKGGLGTYDEDTKKCTCKNKKHYGRYLKFNSELHICTTLADAEIDELTEKQKEKLQTCNKSAATHAWNIEQEECVTKPNKKTTSGYGI